MNAPAQEMSDHDFHYTKKRLSQSDVPVRQADTERRNGYERLL